MNYKKNISFKFIAASTAFTIVLISSLISGLKILSKDSQLKLTAYNKVINLTLPIFKDNSFEEENSNYQPRLMGNLLNLFGINNKKSASIIGKEIAFLSLSPNSHNTSSETRDPEKVFNKFALRDDQVYEEENKVTSSDNVNSTPAFNPELKKDMPIDPEILIYHTHTCESYKPYGINNLDKDKNITSVGEQLKKELEKYGISVQHDTTIHDITTYNKSYERSRVTVNKYLKEYNKYKLIIDLHRDSVENKKAVTTTINGEEVARFMFVRTRKSPNYDKNSQMVEKIINISNKLYPGTKESHSFNKGTFYYDYGKMFFNQDLNDNAVLVEVGSHINTLEEAQDSTKYLARIIAEYINGKK